MRVVDEEPQETIHLYMVKEDELPRKPDFLSISVALLALLCIPALLGITVFTAGSAAHEVSFTLSIQGFHLAPVSKTIKGTAIATGKGQSTIDQGYVKVE
jgi:hypothetical protein